MKRELTILFEGSNGVLVIKDGQKPTRKQASERYRSLKGRASPPWGWESLLFVTSDKEYWLQADGSVIER